MPYLLIAVLAVSLVTAQAGKPVLASVEARWEHAYCDLTELTRTSDTELTARYRYRNAGKKNIGFPPQANLVGYTQAFDSTNGVLYGVIKDSAGKYLSSSTVGDLSAKPLPPGGSQVHWARIEPPPASVTSVTIHVTGCMPFETVPIGAAPAATPLSAPPPPVASQEGEEEGLVVELVEARRVGGGAVLVQVRYRNNGAKSFSFPHQGSALRLAYLTDPQGRQKYTVLNDKKGSQIASSTLQLGGSASGEILEPGAALNIWARFAAPPESVKLVSVTVFGAAPFDKVPLTGLGVASTAGGVSIAGDTVGLAAALKDLDAKVTDAEIRIDLAADVLFDFDKAVIKEAAPSLQKLATVLNANPGATVAIEGHTDGKGADAYNQTLSEQRATAVKQWLVSNARVPGANITTRGWGRTKPVTHNTRPDGSDDPEGRAKNRRVEIVVRKGG